jgi:MYXO-CTERM domain-containing protein
MSAEDPMRNHLLPFRILFVLAAALAFAPATASAQILVDVPDVTASPGEGNVILSVHIENQVPFSGFQLDLNYPVQVAIPGVAIAGSQTASAGWSVYSNLTANGTFIIAFSMNSTPITPGTGPVAHVEVAILPSAIPGSYPIEAANVVISDPQGIAVPATISSGVLTIIGAGDDDDSAGDDDDSAGTGDDDDTATSDDDDDSAAGDDDDDSAAGDDDDDSAAGDDDDDSATADDDDDDATADDDDSATADDDDDDATGDDDDDDATGDDDDDDATGDDDDSADGRAGGCSCSAALSDSAMPGAATLLALTALGLSRRRRLIND